MPVESAKPVINATGRRKEAIASVWLSEGAGVLTVNGRTLEQYFPVAAHRNFALQPLAITNSQARFDIKARLRGGGPAGQAGALRHSIARALVGFDNSLRAVLKNSGFLTRDPRTRERTKPGQPGARKRFQFSKR